MAKTDLNVTMASFTAVSLRREACRRSNAHRSKIIAKRRIILKNEKFPSRDNLSHENER
jgi:hypothetical protein